MQAMFCGVDERLLLSTVLVGLENRGDPMPRRKTRRATTTFKLHYATKKGHVTVAVCLHYHPVLQKGKKRPGGCGGWRIVYDSLGAQL